MATEVSGVRDIPRVVVTAGRLIARHWPALLALAFLGAGLRAGALWAAVVVSNDVPFLGQLILVLAPLGYLLPIIAMLHLCRGSLPNLSTLAAEAGPDTATEGRERRLVDVAVSVLVPFLAVYVSYGLLDQDIARFRNEAAYNEFSQLSFVHSVHYDYAGRLGIYPLQIALMIVLIAWVLRWALGKLENRTKFLALAFLGALFEVYYTGQVAGQSVVVKSAGQSWIDRRDAYGWVHTRYADLLSHLGWFAHPVNGITTGLFNLIGSLDAVVVVPVAWLTVGAVVLGHKLAPPAPLQHPMIDRWNAIPARVRTTAGSLLSDIKERFSAFWNGLRLMAAAGLVPMLVFSLVFLLVIRIPTLVSELLRLLVGPLRFGTWEAISPFENAIGLSLAMALTAPLLAAALEWLVAPSLEAAEEAATGEPEAPHSPDTRTTPAPA